MLIGNDFKNGEESFTILYDDFKSYQDFLEKDLLVDIGLYNSKS